MKTYTGSVYIGVVGPETEIGECRDSIEQIIRRPDDARPRYVRATKGYEARQMHLNTWYTEGKHEYLLLLDHDMIFGPETLERLRSHGLPFISGYYMRRQYGPMIPIWFKPFRAWPMEPFMDPPDKERLHKIGASGWGVMLMHRDVVTATKPLLKGEDEIIEDDMDVWPYDLGRVMEAIHALRELYKWVEIDEASLGMIKATLKTLSETLTEEIRPLRGNRTVVGSDIRFPFYAKQAGFQLWGDPNVAPRHVLNYPLSADDFALLPPDALADAKKHMRKHVLNERRGIRRNLAALDG